MDKRTERGKLPWGAGGGRANGRPGVQGPPPRPDTTRSAAGVLSCCRQERARSDHSPLKRKIFTGKIQSPRGSEVRGATQRGHGAPTPGPDPDGAMRLHQPLTWGHKGLSWDGREPRGGRRERHARPGRAQSEGTQVGDLRGHSPWVGAEDRLKGQGSEAAAKATGAEKGGPCRLCPAAQELLQSDSRSQKLVRASQAWTLQSRQQLRPRAAGRTVPPDRCAGAWKPIPGGSSEEAQSQLRRLLRLSGWGTRDTPPLPHDPRVKDAGENQGKERAGPASQPNS